MQDPKVKGTWNVHDVLLETSAKLDFFILFSSVSGVMGHSLQANYSSANTFLDSFVQYRHSLALPCSVIDLGAVEGFGFLHERASRANQYHSLGLSFLGEQEVIDAVHVSILNSYPRQELGTRDSRGPRTNTSQIAVGLRMTTHSSKDMVNNILGCDPRYSMYGNQHSSAPKSDAEATDTGIHKLVELVEASPELLSHPDTQNVVTQEVGQMLFFLMQVPKAQQDVNRSFASLGIDSLIGVEIRNRCRRTLGLDLTVLDILSSATIRGLGELLLSKLKERHQRA